MCLYPDMFTVDPSSTGAQGLGPQDFTSTGSWSEDRACSLAWQKWQEESPVPPCLGWTPLCGGCRHSCADLGSELWPALGQSPSRWSWEASLALGKQLGCGLGLDPFSPAGSPMEEWEPKAAAPAFGDLRSRAS